MICSTNSIVLTAEKLLPTLSLTVNQKQHYQYRQTMAFLLFLLRYSMANNYQIFVHFIIGSK